MICFDKDIEALQASEAELSLINSNFTLIKSDFRYCKEQLAKLNINAVDGILADLGVSSPQLENLNRGFSYLQNTNLDMRMDLDASLTAQDILNHYEEKEIAMILTKNADVKLANLIAKAIIKNRPILNSFQLNEILKNVLPAAIVRQKNPSKAVFQALRIAVNDELEALKDMLNQSITLLKPNGKLAIITFHSKEDVIVKQFFQKLNYQDPLLNKLPIQIDKL